MPRSKENKILHKFEKRLIADYLKKTKGVLYRKESLKNSVVVAGVDEAGRGAIAGPVVAAAIIFPTSFNLSMPTYLKIDDSKKLSPGERKKSFSFLQKNCISWSTGIVSSKTIDKKNILNATFLAMRKAVENLSVVPDLILVDGIHTIPKLKIPQIAVKDGDSMCISIAAASILAKVIRDRIMEDEGKIYPEFNFSKNKGYGTKEHFLLLKRYGKTPIHRESFL